MEEGVPGMVKAVGSSSKTWFPMQCLVMSLKNVAGKLCECGRILPGGSFHSSSECFQGASAWCLRCLARSLSLSLFVLKCIASDTETSTDVRPVIAPCLDIASMARPSNGSANHPNGCTECCAQQPWKDLRPWKGCEQAEHFSKWFTLTMINNDLNYVKVTVL